MIGLFKQVMEIQLGFAYRLKDISNFIAYVMGCLSNPTFESVIKHAVAILEHTLAVYGTLIEILHLSTWMFASQTSSGVDVHQDTQTQTKVR